MSRRFAKYSRALPREGHSHFKMTGSILVGNAWILVVRLQYESVAFSIYPVVFSIFQLIRTQKGCRDCLDFHREKSYC